MPKDTVQSAIQRGAGGLEGANYEEIRYEGYGIGGAAVIVDCMTDNRIRTVAEVRHAFSKNGGNLGTDGSVAFLFKHCGQFLFAPGTSEDKVMEAAIEAGADDVVQRRRRRHRGRLRPDRLRRACKQALGKAGLKADVAEITMKPLNETVARRRRRREDAEAARRARKPRRRAAGLHATPIIRRTARHAA